MSKPIKPSEIAEAKTKSLPPEVFDAFNELIAREWDGHQSVITQEEAIKAVRNKTGLPRQKVFDLGYLDVEDSYRAAGWVVIYDKPAYNETYEPNFTFRKKRK